MEGDLVTREDLVSMKEQLGVTFAMAEENNRLIKRMIFWGRVAFWAKVVIWVLVLAIPVVIYSWFGPYIKDILGGGFPSIQKVQQNLQPQGGAQ